MPNVLERFWKNNSLLWKPSHQRVASSVGRLAVGRSFHQRFFVSLSLSAEHLSIRVQRPCTFLQTSVSLSSGFNLCHSYFVSSEVTSANSRLHPARDGNSSLASAPKWRPHHTPWIMQRGLSLVSHLTFSHLQINCHSVLMSTAVQGIILIYI